MQGLTDNAHNPKKVSSNILNIVADYLAVGIEDNIWYDIERTKFIRENTDSIKRRHINDEKVPHITLYMTIISARSSQRRRI